jgi:UDP-N-acetyl-D-mannosaminuronic acid dehydrogenase
MIVSVIGLGYIGLPTAALIASNQIKVFGIDVNKDIVTSVNEGKIHIIEPNLEELVYSAVKDGNLSAASEPNHSDVFIVAVPTPFMQNHKPDLSFIKSASKSIAKVLKAGNLVILESTSPVGTSEKMMEWMKEERSDLTFPDSEKDVKSDVFIAHCPERVLPGNIIRELVLNDRVIGGISKHCSEIAHNFYKKFVKGDCLLTDSRTAEMCKLVENSFRDVNIAFANELSIICDKLDINVWNLIKLANHHPRVNILKPGPGVGGHCIAVDPWFIVDSAPEEAKIIKLARDVNDEKPDFVLKKIKQAVINTNKHVSQLNIACFGLSFKADIDDLRESPALEIVTKISNMGFARQFIVEPNIKSLPSPLKAKSAELLDLENAIIASDILLLLVDHAPFKIINPGILTGKQIVDTRGIW